MYMSTEEILRSYRGAKFKKKQIGILAELNLCDRKAIIKTLIDGGVDPKELPPLPRYQKDSAYFPAKKPREPAKGARKWVWNPGKCKGQARSTSKPASHRKEEE